jgi:hypothetical protein
MMSRRISVRVPARSASCTIESPEAETDIGIVDQQGDNGLRRVARISAEHHRVRRQSWRVRHGYRNDDGRPNR